ncbi:plexin domain-containing protein 1 isoform X2 [Hippocampus zosterae]|uniref:plexin domain-containing protein 1 isoform X2 n=1 Tax=Hippocampus zosterae TaxID=109293 RepID=UPI00223E74FF|nr:plexin domain-containing protein 1 isoform X2 [Hippocampus zosterae]
MELGGLLLVCLLQAQLGTLWTHEDSESGTPPERSASSLQRPRGARSAPPPQGGRLDITFLPENMSHIVDSQRYYSWQSFGPDDGRTQDLWVDLDSFHKSQVRIHGILSNAHQKAAMVALSFDFPFYGHYLRQIIVATGGFIFMGEITHRMLTATQYIAPLMANFDPSFSINSTVRYSDNGHLFVIQWDKVQLKDRETEGAFTFQAVLYRNGTVVFNYREIPVPVERINSTEHPVKVGMSDAFMADIPTVQTQTADTKQRTIYEYHRVEINTTMIVSGSAFEFTPLPTCLQHTSCDVCLGSNLTSGCGWCNTLQRCSDGIDRLRQEWLDYNCPEEAKGTCEDYYSASPEDWTLSSSYSSATPTSSSAKFHNDVVTGEPPEHTRMTENAAIIAGVVGALVLVVALTLLAVYYINTHPTLAPPCYLMQRRSNNYWPAMKFRNQDCPSGYGEVELTSHEKEGFIEAEQCC